MRQKKYSKSETETIFLGLKVGVPILIAIIFFLIKLALFVSFYTFLSISILFLFGGLFYSFKNMTSPPKKVLMTIGSPKEIKKTILTS